MEGGIELREGFPAARRQVEVKQWKRGVLRLVGNKGSERNPEDDSEADGFKLDGRQIHHEHVIAG